MRQERSFDAGLASGQNRLLAAVPGRSRYDGVAPGTAVARRVVRIKLSIHDRASPTDSRCHARQFIEVTVGIGKAAAARKVEFVVGWRAGDISVHGQALFGGLSLFDPGLGRRSARRGAGGRRRFYERRKADRLPELGPSRLVIGRPQEAVEIDGRLLG